MLKLAVLALASAAGLTAAAASASSSDVLVANSPWWEKVTVTMTGDGQPQSCRYESSLTPNSAQTCDVSADQAAVVHHSSSSKDELTRITFERRFTPGIEPKTASVQTGDMQPGYGCHEASAERFNASLGGAHPAPREGYMTILVYGHSEHLV